MSDYLGNAETRVDHAVNEVASDLSASNIDPETIDAAIEALTIATDFYAEIGKSEKSAAVRVNLAKAYLMRMMGAREENVSHAILEIKAALPALPLTDRGWALNQLGRAYRSWTGGNMPENLTRSLAAHRAAVKLLRDQDDLLSLASALVELAEAVATGASQGSVNGVVEAIALQAEALGVYEAFARKVSSPVPGDWATSDPARSAAGIRHNLARSWLRLYELSDSPSPEQLQTAVDIAEGARASLRSLSCWSDVVEVCKTLGHAYTRQPRPDWESAADRYVEACAAADIYYFSVGTRLSREAIIAGVNQLPEQAAYILARAGRTADAVVLLDHWRARLLGESLALRPRSELAQPVGDLLGVLNATTTEAPIAYITTAVDATLILLVAKQRNGRATKPTAIWADGFTDESLRELVLTSAPASTSTDHTTVFSGEETFSGYLPAQFEGLELKSVISRALNLIGKEIMLPLADALRETRASGVTLVPCGDLGLFPIHCAPYQRDDVEFSLIDELDVWFAPAAHVVAALGRTTEDEPRTRAAHPTITVIADPTKNLSGAIAEATCIAALFDPSSRHILMRDEATLDAVVPLLPDRDYVHFACHADFDPRDPHESGLALASNERLTLSRLAEEKLLSGTKLVVASACQTALQDSVRTPNEMLSLLSGLIHAGTRMAIGSLWPVADLPTALLMHRFYELAVVGDASQGTPQRPLSATQALRAAQRWLAQAGAKELAPLLELAHYSEALKGGQRQRIEIALSRGERPFEHPTFWAAWILVGGPNLEATRSVGGPGDISALD